MYVFFLFANLSKRFVVLNLKIYTMQFLWYCILSFAQQLVNRALV